MRPGPACGLNRRAFLKLMGLSAAAAWLRPGGGALPGEASRPLIASNLPLAYPHRYFHFPDADSWLARRGPEFDLLLVPAYAAAALIQRGEARELAGERFLAPGRAHDPDGAFTVPHSFFVSALLSRGASPASWADLWRAGAAWPDSARLVMGAALLRRGYSPNDTHPGHLAQIEEDLLALRPRLAADPAAEVRRGAAALAWALAPANAQPSTAGEAQDLRRALPAEGALLVEYDWVIPRRAPNGEAALAFLRWAAPETAGAPASLAVRLRPLAALPAEALAQRTACWARLCQGWGQALTPGARA